MGQKELLIQVVHALQGASVPFMLTGESFDQSRFARRETVPVFGLAMPVSTPEDTILQKPVWSRMSGGSDRQRLDARRVMEVQRPGLDIPYLREWASRLGVEADLDALGSSR